MRSQMSDRQRPRARVLAAVCVLALVAAVVAVALVPSGATFARFFDEAGDSSGSTLSSQQIAATTAGIITPDYGDWNWFDRQTNETKTGQMKQMLQIWKILEIHLRICILVKKRK